MNSLFDRIASEMAERSEVTAEIPRMSLDDSGPNAIVIDGTDNWPAPDISTQIDRPRLANRQCSRSGCSDAAAVTLSYHYGQSQVWIDNLTPERDPHQYDLCSPHAARLSVMRGWHLDDRRKASRSNLVAV